MSELFNKEEYRKRLIDSIIDDYLQSCGAICIEGPKWCGKTWTSAYHSNSEFFVGDPDGNFANRELAMLKPSLVLKGEIPRMIDEWQEVPKLWDAARNFVDRSSEYGLLILTGSSTPRTKGIMHTGAGRIVNIRMNTMSLYESGDSSGLVSLKELAEGKIEEQLVKEVELEDLARLIVRGGWPRNIKAKNPLIMPKSYVYKIINGNPDDKENGSTKKFSKDKLEKILKSLARNETTTASINKIASDIENYDGTKVSPDTVGRYIEELRRMFLFNDQPPYETNVRSSLRIKGSEKRHFCDPSLACALLDLNEKKLMGDLNTFGFLFEALVERDLSIYAQSIGAKLYHYQNYSNEEIDAVIELDDGNWCAFEIKLGGNRIDEGAKNLIKVCNHIVENGGKEPVVKAVICGLTNAIYQREDGVFVFPITCLKN